MCGKEPGTSTPFALLGGVGTKVVICWKWRPFPLIHLSIEISGVLTSPNFPDNYPNDLDKIDMIAVAPGKRIDIVFTNFTVQPHPSCRHDQVSISDQDGTELLGISCGLELPPGKVQLNFP